MIVSFLDGVRDMLRGIKCLFGAHDLVRLRHRDGTLEDVCFYCDRRRPVPPSRD